MYVYTIRDFKQSEEYAKGISKGFVCHDKLCNHERDMFFDEMEKNVRSYENLGYRSLSGLSSFNNIHATTPPFQANMNHSQIQ